MYRAGRDSQHAAVGQQVAFAQCLLHLQSRGLHPSNVSPHADPSCRRLKEVNAKCPQQLKAYYECMDYYR